MGDVAVAVWIAVVAAGVGFLLAPRRLWVDVPELRVPLAFALGAGALIGLVFASGMTGTLHSLGKWGILPAGTVAAAAGWRRERGPVVSSRRDPGARRSRVEVFLFGVLVILAVKNLLAALTPEVRHDALDYHIQLPNLYAVKGRMADESWTVMSYLPFNLEMLYTLALLWGGDTAAKLLHFGFGLLTAAAVTGLGRRWFRPSVGLLAGALFYLQPQVAMISNTAFNDLGRALFETLATAVWFELWAPRGGGGASGGGRGLAVLLAVLAGLSLGVKWPAFPVFFVPLAAAHGWFLARHRMPWRAKAREMAVLAGIALLLFLPWCARNLLFTGNPIYPFLNRALGLTDPVSAGAEAFFGGLDPPPETYSIPGIFGYWGSRLRDIGLAGSVLVNLFLILIPLAGLVRWNFREEEGRGPELFGGFPWRPTPASLGLVYLVPAILGYLWFTYNADGRFLLPAYPVMALLVAQSVDFLLVVRGRSRGGVAAGAKGIAGSPVAVVLFVVALSANTVYHQVTAHRDLREPWLPVLGEARERFWRDRYPLLETLDGLPAGSLVLGAGFPARIPYACTVKHGRNVVEERIGSTEYGGRELHRALRESGFTHVYEPSGYPLNRRAAEELRAEHARLAAESGRHRLYLLEGAELVHSEVRR